MTTILPSRKSRMACSIELKGELNDISFFDFAS